MIPVSPVWAGTTYPQTDRPLRIGSLCSGYGGLDMAVQAVLGGELAWVADSDPGATAVLAHHHPDVPNLGDITAVDWSELSAVDIVTAGYPCQPFSDAGLRKGVEDERHIWPYIATAIRVLRPRLVVLENVRGHLRRGFDVVLGDLAALGFDAEWRVVRASDVGAPHGRPRLIVLAIDADAPHLGHERGWGAWGRRPGSADGGLPAADAQGAGRQGAGSEPAGRGLERGDRPSDVQWGGYEPAIRRWEGILGRPAPRPTEPGRSGERLSPLFTEWLMGLPAGHVTDVPDLTRNQQLKALGNGVVWQQAVAALSLLLNALKEAAA